MTPQEALTLRAHRILTDGLPHSQAAILWARGMLLVGELFGTPIEDEGRANFTDREMSLGAQKW